MAHNLVGRQAAQLETFSGTVTLAGPDNLPEGASPRTQNVDFAVGGTFTRQGLENPFTYSGNSVGPIPGGSAVNTPITGNAWANPSNVLADDLLYASVTLASSGSASSSTSTGTSTGGGAAWTTPENIDSAVSFASVSLSPGGTSYNPSQISNSVSNAAGPSNTAPPEADTVLNGFASVPATACTLYVTLNGTISASQGGGAVILYYSINNGVSWTQAGGWSSTFSASFPITITGITNLNTIKLRIGAACGCSPTGFCNVYGIVTNWYATVSGSGQLTAQTLSAAISGLTIPTNATITGFGISFNGDYAGASPSFHVGLSVGNVQPPFTLTASPAIYTYGGNGVLWGYSSWTASTLNSLKVNFFASAASTSTVNVNTLVVTVYYTVSSPASDAIDITQFGMSLPSTVVLQGFVVTVKGFSAGASTIKVQMLKAGVPTGSIKSITPHGTVAAFPVGGINDLFGASWAYSDLNNTTFGIRITATGAGSTISVGYVSFTAYYVATRQNFNYLTTFEDNFGNIRTLAMDGSGEWFIANVNSDPWSLSALFSGPPPGSFASSFTADSRQFIALSDLSQGNYPPQSYNNQWRDRVSQVGPGAAPAFTGTLQTGNVASITAYAYSAGILTLTAVNNFTAGEVVVILAGGGDALAPLNGLRFNVLGTGLSGTQFEIATVLVAGSGSSTATATGQYTYPIAASPTGITQYAVQPAAQPGFFDCVLQSSGPGATNAGNTITIYYLNAFTHAVGDANLIAAVTNQKFPVYVYVSGVSIAAANGTQLVTGIGIATPPGGGDQRYYFTFNVTSSAYEKLGSGSASVPGAYQQTVATIKTTLPLPGVQIGDDLTISGDPVSSWDETWQIVNALNSGSYSISQTSMTSGVATYNWALSGATSTPPVAGELVTVTGCLNGNGVFNVTDASIATVTGTSSGTFTVTGFANQTFSTQTEVAQAVTSGTEFLIDPGPLTLGNPGANPIYGNSGGGYVTLVGSSSVVVATGTRRGVVFFITRNGFWTQPSPFAQFTVTDNTNYLLASNIPIGPPNVIARGIAFTEAGQFGQPGASYYTIPNPVSFVYNGVTYLSSALIINDNTTTSAQFTFPDTVLLDATEIDIQGNALFNLGELGDAAWCAQYAGRSVWGRVRNKIQNFINLPFDGGYNPNPGANILPLGWGLDASTAPQNSLPTLLTSPVFGQSYYIKNLTGSTKAQLGMLTQTAYQDQNAVAILQNQTAYSVRVTCRTPSSAIVGSLVIDLTDFNSGSGYGQTYGSFTLALSAMTSTMATYEGALLTNVFLSVPQSLVLRLWASGLANNGDVEIDRVDIFPTEAPTNLTGLTISYKNDWESFDQVTGGTDTNTVNAQPANGAFEMNGLLYILKESSLGYIADTPNQEPANWNPYKEVSNVAGACGINAYDVGKKWAITACQSGLYLFNGGEPVPIHLEVPDIWQAITWSHSQSLCVRNDTANNRIMVACPMVTPNQWCPDFPANDGTTGNNVILYVNYDGIGTIEELMSAESMHMTIMGKLAVHDMKRKWSLWSTPCPYMALCKISELESELLIGNGIQSSKIYILGAYESGQDDGVDFTSSYCTYGFVDDDVAKENPVFGLNNKRYVYYDLLISGNASINDGNMSVTFFQNSLSAPYPFVVPGGIDLEDPQTNNIEGPLDEFAQRMFVEIKATGKYFNLSHIALVAQADSFSPIRGF